MSQAVCRHFNSSQSACTHTLLSGIFLSHNKPHCACLFYFLFFLLWPKEECGHDGEIWVSWHTCTLSEIKNWKPFIAICSLLEQRRDKAGNELSFVEDVISRFSYRLREGGNRRRNPLEHASLPMCACALVSFLEFVRALEGQLCLLRSPEEVFPEIH